MHWVLDAANAARRNGDITGCLTLLSGLLDDWPPAHVAAEGAHVAAELEQYTLAQLLFEHALAIDPDLAAAHSGLAIVLAELGKADEALVEITIALQLRETVPRLIIYGDILDALGREGEAITALQRALQLEPDNEEALVNLGVMLGQSQPDMSLSLYRKAIEVDGEYGPAQRELGFGLLFQGAATEARCRLVRAAELMQDDPWTYLYLGHCEWRLGNHVAASRSFKRAMRIAPLWSLPYVAAGTLFEERGRGGMARRLYAVAHELEPKSPRPALRLAEYWLQLGDEDRAKFWLLQVIKNHPEHERARHLLEQLQS